MPPRFRASASFLPFTSLLFLAADTGGGNGGGEQTETPKPAADISTLPKAKARIAELETEAASLVNARDQALTAQKAAEIARDQATEIAKTTGVERDQARTELNVAQGQIKTLTTERDTARTDLKAAQTNVSRLETLCGVRGLNPNEVPVAATDLNVNSGAALYEQFEKLSGAARTTFYRQHQKALDSYAESFRHK